jgi:catechol 2,3-dioxygenase-like lactoylglutathione lyase family enzyme
VRATASAPDLEASVRFYTEVFGMERVATPKFAGLRVAWLRVGDQQLHLLERDDVPRFQHLGLDVDDFEAAYEKVRELEIRDERTFLSGVVQLPGGEAQMYLRDPAGNLVEIDCPDASGLDRSVVTDLVPLVDLVPQDDEGLAARLYTGAARHALGER